MKTTNLFALSVVSLLAAVTSAAGGGNAPVVPDKLRAPSSQRLSLRAEAIGVQIYECKPASDNPQRFEWVLKAPEAKLIDGSGRNIGTHYAGPTWQLNDGSVVIGEVKARDESPDADAIPWLLLSAKSGPGASGQLARTASVQRLNTVGGKPPAGGCTAGDTGRELRVPYRAVYYFYSVGGPRERGYGFGA